MAEAADVIVVGAGAAGIAAARELRDAGRRVIVLEARNRIGGRVLTVRHPRVGAPLEQGAEFVHGEAPETTRIARDAGLLPCSVAGESWRAAGGTLRRQRDLWRRIDRVLARLDQEREPDRSFAEFLDARPGGRSLARDRTLAREFVQGFHAADPARASERALAAAGPIGEMMRQTARIVAGYDRVIEWLAVPLGGAVRLEAAVATVDWTPGAVRVQARGHGAAPAGYQARAAIITVPLAVLRTVGGPAPALRFAPDLPQSTLHAIDGMATGSVVRITLVLRDRLWEDPGLPGLSRGSRLDRLSYLHVSGGRFNVWWTLFPVIDRVIVGWSGGPPARELAALGRSAIEDIAIDELALRALGVPRARLEASLETCILHDWEHDPFSRGAYSYALVGGAHASAALARPVENTLFFAGEAADVEGRTGTVEGAIGSGRRAARRVLAVLADAR